MSKSAMKRSIQIVYKRIGDRHGPTGSAFGPKCASADPVSVRCPTASTEYTFFSLPRPLYTTDSTEFIRKYTPSHVELPNAKFPCYTPGCEELYGVYVSFFRRPNHHAANSLYRQTAQSSLRPNPR